MPQDKRTPGRDVVRTVRLVGEELPGGWQISLWWYGYDNEGDSHEGDHLNTTVSIPWVETDVDQAWLVLMTGLHMLEQAGSVGSTRTSWRSPMLP